MKKNYNIKYKKETRRIVNEIKRFIISKMIDDLILETKKNITLLKPSSADDVREMKKPLVIFSEEMNSNIKEIRNFLMNKMYRNWKINIMTNKAKNIVSDLFKLYNKEINLLPLEWNVGLKKTNNKTKARVISDYIAGMTDRYAIREHQKLLILLKAGISVNIYKNTKKLILKSLYTNFKNLNEDLESKVTCEQPKNSKFGDISSNVILVASKTLNLDKKKYMKLLLKSLLKNEFFIKAEFIDPGFLNLYFSNDYWLDFLKKINLEGDNFGFSNIGKNKKINVEFVSANPTGPLHIGHLRGAIFGDVLSKLLTKTGFRVTKEYYVNDLGAQVDNLAATIQHHVKNKIKSESIPLSDNMYKGEYLKKIADKYQVSSSTEINNLEKIKVYSVKKNLELIQKDLNNLDISFDNYVSEKKFMKLV